jgi:hypothetical protein
MSKQKVEPVKAEQADSVAACEAVIAQLEAKRAACVQRGTELQHERANVALLAHTGDAKARKRLDELRAAAERRRAA